MSSWTDVDTTMASYICLGIITFLIIIPPNVKILTKKKLLDRKEFVLLACVSLVDSSYVFVNTLNSAWRIWTPSYMTTREHCITLPMIFLSTVVSMLMALMPFFAGIDRVIALTKGVWYYRRKKIGLYIAILCAIPTFISLIFAVINMGMIIGSAAGKDQVSSLCFSSGLIHPSFFWTYYGTKWVFILLATIIFIVVMILHSNDHRMNAVTSDMKPVIKNAYFPMAYSTFSTVVFLLLPDMALIFTPSKSLIFTTSMYGIMLLKPLGFNAIMLGIHEELRREFLALWWVPLTSVVKKMLKKVMCKNSVKPADAPKPTLF